MSERSVAEILGWTLCDVDDCPDKGEHWITDEGQECDWWETPSVDDMLAWLVATGHAWSAQKFQTGVALTIAHVETGVEWIPPAFEAPTLHAALEAAVRAVADAARECGCYTVHEERNASCPLNQ